MRASFLTGIRSMEVRDVPIPELRGSTDVLVRMGAVGVCGSDVHYYREGGIGKSRVDYPFTVGHEGAGVVERIGADVSGLSKGERVVVDPAITCDQCDQCKAGRPNTCRDLRFMSCPGEHAGMLAEYILAPARNCCRIPDKITLEAAALSEPLSVGLYAVKQSIPMNDTSVAILGSGPIGLSVLLAAKQEGAERIYVTDRIDERLTAAGSAGALWTGNVDRENVVESILALEPLQPDVVFECCGEQEAIDQGIEMLKPGGKLMVLGIPEAQRVSFDVDQIRRKEITVYYVRRQRYSVQPALDLIASGSIDVDLMVTHRYPLEDAQEAFELVADYRDNVIKAMVRMENG